MSRGLTPQGKPDPGSVLNVLDFGRTWSNLGEGLPAIRRLQ
jgi:hypothetical protein